MGPELNHVVYFVGEDVGVAGGGGNSKGDAVRDSAAEMGSFLAFAEAFAGAAAAATPCRSLPEVVVVTRGVHACVESDMVRRSLRQQCRSSVQFISGSTRESELWSACVWPVFVNRECLGNGSMAYVCSRESGT